MVGEHVPTVDVGVLVRQAWRSETRGLSVYRLPLLAGVACLAAVLVINVPGVAPLRAYKAPATALSHVALALIAFGLSPRFPGWVARVAALSSRQRVLWLAAALAGPLVVMVPLTVVAPRYGHQLFTREWGVVEPLQFVLWLTAAWLAFEIARHDGRGTAEHRVFRLAGFACILLAVEEIDYFGIVAIVAKASGVSGGRIAGHHIGGLHDLLNELSKASLLLGLFALALVAALVFAWAVSRGLHRVVLREILSPTARPLVGTVVFMAIGQLADIDHPVLERLLGGAGVLRDLCEEPMELLAIVCVNASLLATLVARPRPAPAAND